MSSSKDYLEFILDQLSSLDEISYKAMMGEYIIYYQGKIIGGIYDDRFLVKPTKSAKQMMPNAQYETPYDGAKEMLLVDDIDNKDFLNKLLNSMVDELPAQIVEIPDTASSATISMLIGSIILLINVIIIKKIKLMD